MKTNNPYNILVQIFCIIITILLSAPILSGQPQNTEEKPARILFLLDGSSSMLNDWQKQESRFKTAARIIASIVDSIHSVNHDVMFGLRVYGTQFPAQEQNCFDSKLEVPFGYHNSAQIQLRLKSLQPKGYSPIAWSLKEAAEKDFVQSEQYAYSIILLTDGGESCNGDICSTAEQLLQKKVSFKPYILSLVDYEPLRLQYECLGKYLTVTTEKDILPIVNTIIEDNRKMLSVRAIGIRSVATTSPQVKKDLTQTPPTPVIEPQRTHQTQIKIQRLSRIHQLKKLNISYVLTDRTLVKIPKLSPIKILPEEEVIVTNSKPTLPPSAQAKTTPTKPSVSIEPLLPPRTKIEIQKIRRTTQLRKMGILYTLTEGTLLKIPKLPHLKIPLEEVPVILTGDKPKPLPRATPVSKEGETEPVEFEIQTSVAKETTVQVYFTNGKGKFYNTEPKMVFIDNKTQKEIKSAYRNMNGGEPEPIKLLTGTYDILIPGSKAKLSEVSILENKTNKVTIIVKNGSIAFHYPTAPQRPVKEYRALVSKRFEQGPVVKQNCDEVLPYDPTNYHIEINTLPPLTYNVDVGFNEIKLIKVPESGTLQITNRQHMGKVQFWHLLGDGFVPFHEMMVAGNLTAQKVEFRPGKYQVRYFRGPMVAGKKAEVVNFSITSNQTTNVELNP